mgnify:CR=1 FL=1
MAIDVNKLYQQYLKREADPTGLEYWSNYAGDPTAAFIGAAEKELGKDIANGWVPAN